MSSPWDLTAEALSQPWRLWTGHLAHWGLGHALVNAVGCAVPLALMGQARRRQVGVALLGLLPLLSLLVLPGLRGEAYRGASGLACVLWAAAGCERWAAGDWRLGWMVLGLLAVKLILEALFGIGALATDGGWRAFPAAHRWGALLGVGLGCAWRPWVSCGRPATAR